MSHLDSLFLGTVSIFKLTSSTSGRREAFHKQRQVRGKISMNTVRLSGINTQASALSLTCSRTATKCKWFCLVFNHQYNVCYLCFPLRSMLASGFNSSRIHNFCSFSFRICLSCFNEFVKTWKTLTLREGALILFQISCFTNLFFNKNLNFWSSSLLN